MPDLDDEKFELYLKRFRPLLPEELSITAVKRQQRGRLAIGLWALGAAAAMIVGVIGFRSFHPRGAARPNGPAFVEFVPNQPLTMRDADALLATAPTYKPVMDELAFPLHITIPQGQESALAVLRKEKIKL